MKKIICAILIFALILALSAGFFACKEKEAPVAEKDKSTLAAMLVDAAFPEERTDKDAIKNALLNLLDEADLEDAEAISLLSELSKTPSAVKDALLDVKAGDFSLDRAASYRTALQAVASSVSPEIAGAIYFAAASKTGKELSYTSADCQKIASLILGQDAAFGSELLEKLLDGDLDNVNEKQVNTFMITLVASLRKAVGISTGAKDFLYTLAEQAINALWADTSLTDETQQALQKGKTLLLSLAALVRNGYDLILSCTADFLAQADSRLLLGLPYEKQEQVVYYGYTSATWKKTIITKTQYEAREGGYDEYLAVEATVKGFVVDGVFRPITDEDAFLADQAYRLKTAYDAYNLLSDQTKQDLLDLLNEGLNTLATEQELVASLLDRPVLEDNGIAGASFNDLLAAIPALASFDATDGITDAERAAAENAVARFESFLHGYLPKVF